MRGWARLADQGAARKGMCAQMEGAMCRSFGTAFAHSWAGDAKNPWRLPRAIAGHSVVPNGERNTPGSQDYKK